MYLTNTCFFPRFRISMKILKKKVLASPSMGRDISRDSNTRIQYMDINIKSSSNTDRSLNALSYQNITCIFDQELTFFAIVVISLHCVQPVIYSLKKKKVEKLQVFILFIQMYSIQSLKWTTIVEQSRLKL